MKEELVTILEAVSRAQSELAAYLHSNDRNAELAIAKLVGFSIDTRSSWPQSCSSQELRMFPRRRWRE